MLNEFLKNKVKKLRKGVFLKYAVCLYLLTFNVVSVNADEQLVKKSNKGDFSREKQILEINKNLKKLIEENQKLVDANSHLEKQVAKLKNENSSSSNRYNKLKKDRDGLSESIAKVRSTNRRYSKKIKRLKGEVLKLKVSKDELMQEVLAQQEDIQEKVKDDSVDEEIMLLAAVTSKEVKKREIQTMDLLEKIDAFTEEDERLKGDAAKAHYNMGNIYFQKGEYEIAAREYFQALTLMPNDPDVHYNLAFVSSEYLKDYRTALKHYKIYLYLNPQAKDASFINKQILKSELKLRSIVDSPLEKEYK